jgi:hypothetical protein
MYYNKRFTNTTVFIAGCIHHLYIMPLDPVYRFVEVTDTDTRVARRVQDSTGMWSDSAQFGSLANLKGSGGPFRWSTVNFAGSYNHTGSRLSPPQYPTPSTLGDMVMIWSKSNTPDIAGDLCATSPQCGKYCNHEEITAFDIPVREEFYQAMNALSALFFLTIFTVLVLVTLTDAVHHKSIIASYQLDLLVGAKHKSLSIAEVYLIQKQAQSEMEEFERQMTKDDDDGETAVVIDTSLDDFDEYIAPLGIRSPRRGGGAGGRAGGGGRFRRQSSRKDSFRDSAEVEKRADSIRFSVANVVGANSGRLSHDTGKAQNLK